MPRSLLTALAVVIFMPLTAQAQSSALQGAWTITEVSVTTPDTSWTEANPQPGLYIFLEPHYSTLIVQGSEPRDLFSDDPTDAEFLAAYSPFIANSGTYEVSGTTLTVRALVVGVALNYLQDAEVAWRLICREIRPGAGECHGA